MNTYYFPKLAHRTSWWLLHQFQPSTQNQGLLAHLIPWCKMDVTNRRKIATHASLPMYSRIYSSYLVYFILEPYLQDANFYGLSFRALHIVPMGVHLVYIGHPCRPDGRPWAQNVGPCSHHHSMNKSLCLCACTCHFVCAGGD